METEQQMSSEMKNKEIVVGILKGFIVDIELANIKEIIREIKVEGVEFEQSIQYLRQHKYSSIKQGIIELGGCLMHISEMLSNCELTMNNIKKLQKACQLLLTPLDLVLHAGEDLLLNGVSILKYIKAIINDYDQQNWVGVGHNIGIILNLLLIGSTLIPGATVQQ